MFGWLKSKVKKRLSKENDKAIFQCENFIAFAWDWVGESSDQTLVAIKDKLTDLNKKLNQIKKTRKNDGTFSYIHSDKLMELNKDCRKTYSIFNVTKSFDDEFKYIDKKEYVEKNIRMGTKLADLGTLHNLESRTKSSLEKNTVQNNPYSTYRRKDFLSEKSLADNLSKKFEERKKNKNE
mgnify:CR=1 FL=1